MIGLTPETITRRFVEFASNAPSERSREIWVSLVKHLHAFIKETELDHEEWRTGLAGLARAAEMLSPERNEFVLLSDVLGVSSLVDMLGTPPRATSSSVLGPFHQEGSPRLKNGGDLWKGQPGEVLILEGRIVDAQSGASLSGVTLDLWHNADNGLYPAQDPAQPPRNYSGLLCCADDGTFAFSTTRFKPYTVPDDGPAGDMLRALGRSAWRPAHLHLIARAPNYRTVVTEFFLNDDEWLASDAAFGVRDDLVLTLDYSSDPDTCSQLLEVRDRLPARFAKAQMVIRMHPLEHSKCRSGGVPADEVER